MLECFAWAWNVKGGSHAETSLTGVEVGKDVTGMEKIWTTFQAIGNIAFAYSFSQVMVEIQASYLSQIWCLFHFILFFQGLFCYTKLDFNRTR